MLSRETGLSLEQEVLQGSRVYFPFLMLLTEIFSTNITFRNCTSFNTLYGVNIKFKHNQTGFLKDVLFESIRIRLLGSLFFWTVFFFPLD